MRKGIDRRDLVSRQLNWTPERDIGTVLPCRIRNVIAVSGHDEVRNQLRLQRGRDRIRNQRMTGQGEDVLLRYPFGPATRKNNGKNCQVAFSFT
jgi:hypothetical protein